MTQSVQAGEHPPKSNALLKTIGVQALSYVFWVAVFLALIAAAVLRSADLSAFRYTGF